MLALARTQTLQVETLLGTDAAFDVMGFRGVLYNSNKAGLATPSSHCL